MTTNNGEAPAPEGTPSGGAGDNQPSEAEVTKLRADLQTAQDLVGERDTSIVTLNANVLELQGANKKFADDAAGLAAITTQLKDSTTALEESRKTTTDLTTQLEEQKVTNTGLHESVVARRRTDLIAKLGLTEEYVAGLDDAGLTTLESAPIKIPETTPNGKPAPAGTGYGMGDGANEVKPADRSDSENALRLIESMKAPK